MIANTLYTLIPILLMYLGARLLYKFRTEQFKAKGSLDLLKRLGIVPGYDASNDKEKSEKFNNKLFIYYLILAIPIILILSLIEK